MLVQMQEQHSRSTCHAQPRAVCTCGVLSRHTGPSIKPTSLLVTYTLVYLGPIQKALLQIQSCQPHALPLLPPTQNIHPILNVRFSHPTQVSVPLITLTPVPSGLASATPPVSAHLCGWHKRSPFPLTTALCAGY